MNCSWICPLCRTFPYPASCGRLGESRGSCVVCCAQTLRVFSRAADLGSQRPAAYTSPVCSFFFPLRPVFLDTLRILGLGFTSTTNTPLASYVWHRSASHRTGRTVQHCALPSSLSACIVCCESGTAWACGWDVGLLYARLWHGLAHGVLIPKPVIFQCGAGVGPLVTCRTSARAISWVRESARSRTRWGPYPHSALVFYCSRTVQFVFVTLDGPMIFTLNRTRACCPKR